ncbi:3928_t:CDS:2, partial [Funneliformis caledonium]
DKNLKWSREKDPLMTIYDNFDQQDDYYNLYEDWKVKRRKEKSKAIINNDIETPKDLFGGSDTSSDHNATGEDIFLSHQVRQPKNLDYY